MNRRTKQVKETATQKRYLFIDEKPFSTSSKNTFLAVCKNDSQQSTVTSRKTVLSAVGDRTTNSLNWSKNETTQFDTIHHSNQ